MKSKRQPQFECQECGKKFFSVAAAERASFGSGCPKCGGSDIDVYVKGEHDIGIYRRHGGITEWCGTGTVRETEYGARIECTAELGADSDTSDDIYDAIEDALTDSGYQDGETSLSEGAFTWTIYRMRK